MSEAINSIVKLLQERLVLELAQELQEKAKTETDDFQLRVLLAAASALLERA